MSDPAPSVAPVTGPRPRSGSDPAFHQGTIDDLGTPLPERAGDPRAHQPYNAPDAARPRVSPAAVERAPLRPALPGRARQTS